MSDRGPWIETYTGKAFYLLDPQPEDICIEDIAHSLSLQVRWTGQCSKFYSVAEHSYYVSLLCPRAKLWGLLDDGTEAYTGDMNRPLKHHTVLGDEFRKVEEPIKKALAKKFGLAWPVPLDVKAADNTMLYTERQQLMTKVPWEDCDGCGTEVPTAGFPIVGYMPKIAEKMFLSRFYDLTSSTPPAQ